MLLLRLEFLQPFGFGGKALSLTESLIRRLPSAFTTSSTLCKRSARRLEYL